MVAFLVFIIATLEIVFGWKKLLDAKGPFGSNVFKNPARYIRLSFTILSGKDSKIIIKKVNLY